MLVLLLSTSSVPGQSAPDGALLHLDASNRSNFTLSPTGGIFVWKDLSMTRNDVNQPVSSRQPRLITDKHTGKTMVIFNGSQTLDGKAVLPEDSKCLTFVTVFMRNDLSGSQSVLEQSAPGNGRRASLLTVEGSYGYNGESNDQHALIPWRAGQLSVSILRMEENGRITLFHNGYSRSAEIDPAKRNIGVDMFRIGGKIWRGGEFLNGAVGEILVYDRALSDTEVKSISSNLIKKWRVTVEKTDPAQAKYQQLLVSNATNPKRFTEPYRPQFHYTPVDGWMNDPNGMVYFKGMWHLFYQHKPFGGGLAWGHAVSKDMIHWNHLPPAIYPDEHGEIWSGSAVVDQNDTSEFFGGKAGIVCAFTYFKGSEGGRQSQGIAYSLDGIHFTVYDKNPAIPQLRYQPNQPDVADFRDPKLFWHAPTKKWIMIVAGGVVRFYSSPNLRDWTFESSNKDLETECPDFFEMPVRGGNGSKWVLNAGGRWYICGEFDGHVFTHDGPRIPMNYGKDFYASQTFSNAPNSRRLMIAWLYSWGYSNFPTSPFTGGCMTIPYELTLHQTPDGPRLLQNPAPELNALRGIPAEWKDQPILPGQNLLTNQKGKTWEVEAEFEIKSAARVGFRIPCGGDKVTFIGYDTVTKKMYVDRTKAGFAEIPQFNEIMEAPLAMQSGRIKLHLYLDHMSAELFGNDGLQVLTANILPDPDANTLELFSEGGDARVVTLKIWPMKRVW